MSKAYMAGVIVVDTIAEGNAPDARNVIWLMDGYRDSVGGYGNVVPTAVNLFDRVVCGGLVNGGDMRGQLIKQRLESWGADTSGIKDSREALRPDKPYPVLIGGGRIENINGREIQTSASLIESSGSNRKIAHYTGTDSAFSPQHVGGEIEGADVAIILYTGLLLGWDGEPMADFARRMRGKGILTVSAANGADTASDETLGMIRTGIKEINVYVCNREEAEAIAGEKGKGLLAGELAEKVSEVMGMRGGKTSRLLAVTDGAKGCHLVYCNQKGEVAAPVNVPALEVNPVNPTGAGDNFLLGLTHYVVEHKAEFMGGSLNVATAGKYGNAMGALHIAGEIDRVRSPADLTKIVEERFPKVISPNTLPGTATIAPIKRTEPPRRV